MKHDGEYSDFVGMKAFNDQEADLAKAERVADSKKDLEDNQDIADRIADAKALLEANNHTVEVNQ